MAINIFYDGHCPFCSRYADLVELKESVGSVNLIDLRSDVESRLKLEAQGLSLDNGMAVEVGDRLYHGADAINALSLLSEGGSLASVFRHRHVARTVYPLLRAGRNTTLFILGREPIHAREAGETALFKLFNRFFGLYIVLNAAYFSTDLRPLTVALFILGAVLFLRPDSRRLFVVSAVIQAIDAYLQAPANSNHAILQNFTLLVFGLAAIWNIVRGSNWETWFRSVRPVARCLLLTMYVFGIFHKINADFLNPAVSCAVALWRRMPPPLAWVDNTPMHYLAIYGTFAAEGAILLMLIRQKWRHIGIIVGILFHMLLAFSTYATYAAFSTLAAALHILFLTPALALRIVDSDPYKAAERRIQSPAGFTFYIAIFTYLGLSAFVFYSLQVTLAWVLGIFVPAFLIVWLGWRRDQSLHERSFFWSRPAFLNIVTLAFFVNCAAPYFGLKTAQAMNMFSNLRVEGGVSNHLLVNRVGPFHYLDQVVTVLDVKGAPQLEWYAEHQDRGLTLPEFQSELRRHPNATVSYRLAGTEYHDLTVGQVGRPPFSPITEKYLHFRPVDLVSPVRCGNY